MIELAELKKELEAVEKRLKFAKSASSNPEAIIAHCEEHGEFKQVLRKIALSTVSLKQATDCPRCLEHQIAQIQAKMSQCEKAEIMALKANSGIPKRFAQCRFENYHPVNNESQKALNYARRYAEKWQDRLAKGGGLVFCGKPGTGKNHLACAIANSVIEQHKANVLITTALHIAREVKNSWGKGGKNEEDVLRFYAEKDLLIIDEIGVQFGSEAEKIILFEIINTRYEQVKPTILISNLSSEELPNYISERVLDRMKEGQGAIVAFDWESYRK